MDTRLNQGETDVDCGGAVCGSTCDPDETCALSTDCASLNCGGNLKCVAATCMDNIKNQGETDLDCGGANCPASCDTDEVCAVNADCVSGVCGTGNTCAAPSCMDNTRNQGELGVDCGGPCAVCPSVLMLASTGTETLGAVYRVTPGTWVTTSLAAPTASQPAITRLGNGDAVGLVRISAATNDNHLFFTKWNHATDTWSTPADVGTTGATTRGGPAIDLLGANGAQAAYVTETFRFDVIQFDGTAWSSTSQFTGAQGDLGPGLVTTGTNSAALAYYEGLGHDLYVVLGSGSTWGTPAKLTTAGGIRGDISPTITTLPGNTQFDLLVADVLQDGNNTVLTGLHNISDGTWTVNTVSHSSQGRVALLPLGLGNALMAYRGNNDHLYTTVFTGTFFDDNSNSEVTTTAIKGSPALAPGQGPGILAEMVFIGSDDKPRHTRLTSLGWTTPVQVGTTSVTSVSLTSTP